METTLWRNAHVATMGADTGQAYGLLPEHDVLVAGGQIAAIAPSGSLKAAQTIDVTGKLITPALIDCHTHLVFGGSRADEWARRQSGVSYQQISAEGGGINHTVRATRAASVQTLYRLARARLDTLVREGVGLVEIKSGYGLDFDNEEKMLQVINQLAQDGDVQISRTLLAAHAVPPEYAGQADDYLDDIITTIMPELWRRGAFDCVDVFCENVGFSAAQTERLFQAARALGIPVKGHTEQLSHQGGSALVARYGGWSADHIEYLNEADVAAMAQAGTVAVLLPGAFYFLRETQQPPVQLLRDYGVPMAVATDFNPGTSPLLSLRLAMNLACVLFGLTPAEAWQGVTVHAARALRREADFGTLAVGKPAHFNVWETDSPVDVVYEPFRSLLSARVRAGRIQAA